MKSAAPLLHTRLGQTEGHSSILIFSYPVLPPPAEAGTTWTWLDNGDVRTVTKAMPALVRHRRSGEEMFFNAAIAALQGWVDARNDPAK